jgi:WD40 repeat protein
LNRSRTSLAAALVVSAAILSHTTITTAAPGPGPDAPERSPEVWAVIVAIESYDDPEIPACPGALRDGTALARWFTATARWDSPHVLLMNEHGDAQHGAPEEVTRSLRPTRANLDWALKQWLSYRLKPGDIGVVYFAGQSAVLDDREWLLPIDADADDLAHSGWSPEEAVDELAPRKEAALVLWLDAAPPLHEVQDDRPATDQAPAVNLLNQLVRWPGVTAWLAHSRPTAERPGPGPFLAALSRGLGQKPQNLLACLEQMHQDPLLKEGGFRVRGGLSPLLALWPEELLPEHKFKPSLVLQQGHADRVSAVVTTADGEQMITASLDSTIRIWRVRDGAPVLLRVLAYHTNGVTALALSPNGRYIASGDGMGEVKVWDLVEGRERPQEGASPHEGRITAIGFLPEKDRGRFVSLDQEGQSVLWDTSGPVLQKRDLAGIALVRLAVAAEAGPAAIALADPAGRLVLFDGDVKPLPAIGGTDARPTALHLSADGRWVAAGDEQGHVRVWNAATRAPLFQNDYDQKISALRIGPTGKLAVAAGDRLYLAPLDGKSSGPGLVLEGVSDELDSALFSGNGQWLAALGQNGNRYLWSLRDPAHPQARPLPAEGRMRGAASLTFDRNIQRLVAGEGDGGVRSWELVSRREQPRIPPHRGKVAGLAVSPDGRFLLEVTQRSQAVIWDLKEGRGARTLPGRWTAGAFVPGTTRVALCRDANHGGDVVLADRETGSIRLLFERPRARNGNGVSRAPFGRIAVSKDGQKVAAATAPGAAEMVCVWDVQGGPPRVLRGHTGTITALGFSADAHTLMTASEDGTVRLWDLSAAAAGAEVRVAVVDAAALIRAAAGAGAVPAGGPGAKLPITAAEMNAANPRWIVTAHWAPGRFGQVWLWDTQPFSLPGGRPRYVKLGELIGRPHCVVFSPDGRWVGAAGQDKVFHLWALENGKATRVAFDADHQHTEQVKSLAAWPTVPMIASGGDDTMVKLWNLDAKTGRATLLGTLVAAPAEPEDEPARDRLVEMSTRADWVAFTPDGIYDSSLEGERLVSFVLENRVRPLEQYADQFHKFQLTDDLRLGSKPQAPTFTPPPALAIDPPLLPAGAPGLAERDVELKVSIADPALDIEQLRLYQNGVPVQGASDLRRLDDRGHYTARVRLARGPNRFYAMAGRPGDIDARSEDVIVPYDGPEPPSRLHVLALGVKDYARNALRFASLDAQQLAEHLHRSGIEGVDTPGQKIVLTDGDVSERSVQDAFSTLRREVKGRPEDVVVVFLAGHTDVLRDAGGRERFSLLLTPFPFPPEAPLIAMNRGVGVAARLGETLPPGVDLPFHVVYRNLSRLEALQRLVIIDACQAEAIFNDPGVRRIEQALERDTRRARTSYLLAARRGEAANESAILEHGLLTYVLLRGMKAPGLRPLPVPLAPLDEMQSADGDGDGYVTSVELREYADRALPVLASNLPDLMQRAGQPVVNLQAAPLHIQGAEGSGFRLISLRAR